MYWMKKIVQQQFTILIHIQDKPNLNKPPNPIGNIMGICSHPNWTDVYCRADIIIKYTALWNIILQRPILPITSGVSRNFSIT